MMGARRPSPAHICDHVCSYPLPSPAPHTHHLQDYPAYTVPEDQIKTLVEIVRLDLEIVDKQNSTYAMLRALV